MGTREGGLNQMCIAFPGLVVEVDAFGAVVETDGRRRRASTLFLPDIAVGDWVAVAAGTIVERLEPDQAAEIQELLRVAIALEMSEPSAVGDPAQDASPEHSRNTNRQQAPTAREGAPDVHTV
jgi:hydrogenase expression/formation protein HypC